MNQPATNPPLPPVLRRIVCSSPEAVPCSIIIDANGFMVDRATGQPPRLDAKEGTLVNVITRRDALRMLEHEQQRRAPYTVGIL